MKNIEVGQELYYQGIGFGSVTKCFEIKVLEGVRFVHANNGVIRKESDVVNNTCDLYSSKEAINKSLATCYMAKQIE